MLGTKTAEMGMAVGRLKQLSADEATRLRYEARELYLMDEMARNEAAFADGFATGETKGRMEGREEGREEGETKKAIAIAWNALQMGMSIGDISRLTGFSEREIRSFTH